MQLILLNEFVSNCTEKQNNKTICGYLDLSWVGYKKLSPSLMIYSPLGCRLFVVHTQLAFSSWSLSLLGLYNILTEWVNIKRFSVVFDILFIFLIFLYFFRFIKICFMNRCFLEFFKFLCILLIHLYEYFSSNIRVLSKRNWIEAVMGRVLVLQHST